MAFRPTQYSKLILDGTAAADPSCDLVKTKEDQLGARVT
jgi:hypothetical protein